MPTPTPTPGFESTPTSPTDPTPRPGQPEVQRRPAETSTPPTQTTTPPADTTEPSAERERPGRWTPTENPNATVKPGQMRSDREEIPGGATKEMADQAETMEAAKLQSRTTSLTAGCQVYWPFPYEVCGAIKDKYNSLGGPNSFLLWPQSNELVNPDGIGRRSVFMNGPIYWSPAGGAHPVVNHFFACWQRNGWEGGPLGYPTSDEIVNPDGFGRRQEFQGGTIYWKANEAYYVGGAIRTKWNQLGPQPAERSFLGYPLSDEIRLPDGVGRMNRFENGLIYWHSSYGAHPVSGGIRDTWAASGYERGSYGYPIADQTSGTGIQVSQAFEYATMGWPTNPAAAIVDDGDINPTVGDGAPVTESDFMTDAAQGVNPNRGLELISNNIFQRSCTGSNVSCIDERDPETPEGLAPACWTRLIPDRVRGKRDDPTQWQRKTIPTSSNVTRSRCTATPTVRHWPPSPKTSASTT